MNFVSKKNQIEFFNNDSSVIDNYPIIESKKINLNWAKRVREDYENHVKEGTDKALGFVHLARCPGIFDLFKCGYVVPLHADIIIKPNEDGSGFQVKAASSHFFVKHQGIKFLAKPPWAADFIVKIDTGWRVIAPKGVKFLFLPIAYPDTFDFTSTIGILDSSTSTGVNFQMFWNATEPETLIRAGTPLGQLIPLTEKKYQMIQREMTQQERDWLHQQARKKHKTFMGKVKQHA